MTQLTSEKKKMIFFFLLMVLRKFQHLGRPLTKRPLGNVEMAEL